MRDTTLLIIAGAGLAAYWLFKTSPNPAAVTPTQNQPTNNTAGYYPPPQTPRDPGDVNNWLPGLFTGLGSLAGGIVQSVNRTDGNTGSTTPSGWSDIDDSDW